MQSNQPLKDYYQILGVPKDASTFQIQFAYEKLVNQWHPERNKTNRVEAEKKFQEINEAFEVLYNRSSRTHYDQIFHKGYSIDNAESTFNKFFSEIDFVEENEKQLLSQINPKSTVKAKPDYYSVLSVPKNASLDQIKKAYRTLALKYHPKFAGNDEVAKKKFVQINEAFEILSDQKKKQTHEKVFSKIEDPFFKYDDTFEDFFGHKPFEFKEFPKEDEFFKPILKKKWSRNLDRMMEDDFDFSTVSNGETVKESSVYNSHNGVTTKKTVKTKVKITNGVPEETTVEIYQFPNGERDVTRTIKSGLKSEKSQLHLKSGEALPNYENP